MWISLDPFWDLIFDIVLDHDISLMPELIYLYGLVTSILSGQSYRIDYYTWPNCCTASHIPALP